MSYDHIARTASAKAFIEQREREWAAAEALRRSGDTIEASRLWLGEYLAQPRQSCFNWEPRFPFKRPEIIHGEVSEAPKLLTHDHQQDRRETEGTQARSFSECEGLGDTASQEAVSEAPGRGVNQAVAADPGSQGDPSWLDEAYPTVADGRFERDSDTPF